MQFTRNAWEGPRLGQGGKEKLFRTLKPHEGIQTLYTEQELLQDLSKGLTLFVDDRAGGGVKKALAHAWVVGQSCERPPINVSLTLMSVSLPKFFKKCIEEADAMIQMKETYDLTQGTSSRDIHKYI